MRAEFFSICEGLLSATANGVYQGIIITVLVGLALRFFTRTNAATRYAVWFGSLLLIAALIPAHVVRSGLLHVQVQAADTGAASEAQPIILAQPMSENIADIPVTDYGLIDPQFGETGANQLDAGPQQEPVSETMVFQQTIETPPTEGATPLLTPLTSKPINWNLETPVNLPRSICLGLIAAWIIFASVRFGLIAVRIIKIRRAKKTSRAPSTALQTAFVTLLDSLVTRREVRLRIADGHRSAALLGFSHPVILIPAEMDNGANDGEVEHVLRHELAHVERRDDWANLAQQVIEGALFFHPAIWWISRQLSLEREIACDDHAIEASGRPRAYALTLANVAIRMNQCRHSLAPGVSNNNSQLQQRITMILNTNRDRSPRLARSRLGFFTATTAILAVLAINAGPRLVLAESPAAETAEPTLADNTPGPSAEVLLADASPAADSPDLSGPDSGPRYKPGTSDDDSGSLAAPEAAPTPPAAPARISVGRITAVAPMEPLPPLPAPEPMVAVAPMPPVKVSVDVDEAPEPRPERHHMSIEERLDRIERTLDRLQARGDLKDRHHIDGKVSVDGKPMALYAPGQMQMDFKFDDTFKRSAEAAQRAAEQAQRAAEAGQRAAEQAMRDMAKEKGKDFERLQNSLRDMQSEGPARELEALKTARESLDREVQKLTQQIKRLEEQKSHLQKHGRSDDSNDDGNDGKSAPDKE